MIQMRNLFLILFLMICFIPSTSGVTIGSSVRIDTNFTVIYDEFKSGAGTTNLSALNNSQLALVSSLILENSFGKVNFLQPVDLTLVHQNGVINLDQNIEIAQNLFFINNSYFTNLAKSVRVSLYGLSFNSPRILLNGLLCGPPDCSAVSYVGGVLIFDSQLVSSRATSFSAEETPSPPPSGGSSGGGGGGGGGSTQRTSSSAQFSVNESLFDLKLSAGEHVRKYFIVRNIGGEKIDFMLNTEGFNFMSLEGNNFVLYPGDEQLVSFDIDVPSNEPTGVRTGSIIIQTGNGRQNVNIIAHIGNPVLYDLISTITSNTLLNFQQLQTTLALNNLGGENGKVSFSYSVRDFADNEYSLGEEQVDVPRSLTLDKTFTLPESLKSGKYLFSVVMHYGDKVVTTTHVFTLVRQSTLSRFWTTVILFSLLVVAGVGIRGWQIHVRKRALKEILREGRMKPIPKEEDYPKNF